MVMKVKKPCECNANCEGYVDEKVSHRKTVKKWRCRNGTIHLITVNRNGDAFVKSNGVKTPLTHAVVQTIEERIRVLTTPPSVDLFSFVSGGEEE